MHALVIGGTGMLRPVVKDLIKQGYLVSVIASRSSSLQSLQTELQELSAQCNPLVVDYHDQEKLQQIVLDAIRMYGPVILTVAWIHSSASSAPLQVAELASGNFFHIRSASASQPNFQDPFDLVSIKAIKDLHYHQIILGFIQADYGSRWLENDEIVSGILAAMKSAQENTIVGSVTPWSKRPG